MAYWWHLDAFSLLFFPIVPDAPRANIINRTRKYTWNLRRVHLPHLVPDGGLRRVRRCRPVRRRSYSPFDRAHQRANRPSASRVNFRIPTSTRRPHPDDLDMHDIHAIPKCPKSGEHCSFCLFLLHDELATPGSKLPGSRPARCPDGWRIQLVAVGRWPGGLRYHQPSATRVPQAVTAHGMARLKMASRRELKATLRDADEHSTLAPWADHRARQARMPATSPPSPRAVPQPAAWPANRNQPACRKGRTEFPARNVDDISMSK